MPRQRHSAYLLLGLPLVAACAPLLPTPNDFPPPPMTPIVEFQTTLPSTPAPRPLAKPIFADDISGARTLFLILRVAMSAGDSASIAERMLYPVRVRANGQPTMISSAAEFERNYAGIVNKGLQEAIAGADENDLELQLDGIKAAGGALSFEQFCADACAQGQFMVTQINN